MDISIASTNQNPQVQQFSTELKTLFPNVFYISESQNSTLSRKYFQQIQERFSSKVIEQTIIPKEMLTSIRERLEQINIQKYIFLCDYSSVIVLEKQQSFKPTQVKLIFPKSWNFHTQVNIGHVKYSPNDPQLWTFVEIGRMTSNFHQLKKQIVQFQNILLFTIQKQLVKKTQDQGNRKNHHTSTWLIQAAKLSLTIYNASMQKKKQYDNAQIQSKGGVLDVGIHTGITKPNTTIEIMKALLNFIIEDFKLVELMMVDFTLAKVKKEALAIQQFSMDQDKKNRLIYRQLILQIKQLTNNEIKYCEQEAHAMIVQLYEHVDKSFKPWSGNSITTKQLCDSINKQKPTQLIFKTLALYDNDQNKKMNMKNQLGFSNCLTIIKDFTTLLNNNYEQSIWMMMVEQFFFDIAVKRLAPHQVPINIKLNEIVCSGKDFSIMHKVVNKYQSICIQSDKINKYGLMLKNQTYGHLYLIKFIAAAISFEVVKQNRRKSVSNLYNFNIPLDIVQLYSKFYSLSFQATQALDAMLSYYRKNQNKQTLFLLQKSNKSFYDYAKIVGNSSIPIKQWANQKQRYVKSQIASLETRFRDFKIRYIKALIQLSQAQAKPCSCTTETYSHYPYRSYLVKCGRCYSVSHCQQIVNSLENEQFNHIIYPFAENQSIFYGFIYNIPQDILGMMKMMYESQIQIIKGNYNHYGIPDNFFQIDYDPLQPFTQNFKLLRSKFYLNYEKQASIFVQYPSKDTYNYYRNNSVKIQILNDLLQMQNIPKELIQRYQFMLDTPKLKDMKREHQIYSKLPNKARDEGYEQFISLASIRVSQQTQLQILTQRIRNRQIFIKILFESQLIKNIKDRTIQAKMMILLGAAADVNAFKILNKQTATTDRLIFVEQCIEELLQNYKQQWRFQDLYFMNVTGIIFSLLSSKIHRTDLIKKIVMLAYEQFEKYANQKSNKNNQFKSQLAYFIQGILTFFSEQITKSMDAQLIHIWAKLQIQFRIYKVFSDQNIKDSRFRETMKLFEYFKTRAIYNNIDNVRQYFIDNIQELTQIVAIIDKGVPTQLQWKLNIYSGYYVFTGYYGNLTYDFNLFTGILLKNGLQIAGLPDRIKTNTKYVTIFGQNRDFQVYPQQDGSLRTPTDFSQYFHNQAGSKIFFEFKCLNDDLIIRMVVKIQNKQYKYVLIIEDILMQANFEIPPLYLKQYFAWYCKDLNVIVFRKKTLVQMSKIGLILLVKKLNMQVCVTECRIIQNKFKKQSQFQLQKLQNSDHFQHLKLFCNNSNQYNNLAFKILSSIQHPCYIIQVDSPILIDDKWERITKFWLHRYNLKFTFSSQLGIISDNYQGYGISNNYNHHQLLPWGTFQKVNCLILQKIQNDLRFTRNHKYMVLIPDTSISLTVIKNTIPKGQIFPMKIFNYEIHDHFKDLRGRKKIEQIHLANLVAACYIPKMCQLEMTNTQYALNILRSCINTVPLSFCELKKLQNLLSNSINLNQLILIIMAKVVYETSNLLKFILPLIKNQIVSKEEQQNASTLFQQRNALITNCQTQYRLDLQNQKISIRQQLNELQLSILGYSKNMIKLADKNMKNTKWNKKNGLNCDYNQQNQKPLFTLLKKIKKNKITKHKMLLQIAKVDQNEIASSQQIVKINLDNKDEMSKEQKQQIQSSLHSYMILKKKYDSIKLLPQMKEAFILFYEERIKKLQKYCDQIHQTINDLQSQNYQHFDFLTGRLSFIKERDYTDIICHADKIKTFYPSISQQIADIMRRLIIQWIRLKTQLGSLERIILIMKDKQNQDKIGLFRQIQSPRDQISKVPPWLCFELEMKTQIWLSQFETFNLLQQNKNGSVTQLNMGQGKTQIIIPMIVLSQLYVKSQKLPRVNILSPLYRQAQQNYFKFLSVTGFRINLVPLYFNRQVLINDNNIKQMQYTAHLFKNNSLILIDRDSSLSMTLKIRQHYGLKERQIVNEEQILLSDKEMSAKDKLMFRSIPILDIFDEVDALMTSKKSFVYAVGSSSPLPNSRIRFEYAQVFIQILLKEMMRKLIDLKIMVIQESIQSAEEAIKGGKYPRGLRLTQNLSQQTLKDMRKQITLHFFARYLPPEFQFYKHLDRDQKDLLLNYIIDSSLNMQDTILNIKSIPEKVYFQILAARGIVAYGILQHCLLLRCGVDYGAPGKQNLKRVGVPYQAADVPSKRSQYAHPQVAIILSYFSYFNKGLTSIEFEETMTCLMKQTHSSQNNNYKSWLECIEDQRKQPQSVKQVKQINQESNVQKEQLYNCFRYCRSTIIFWLIHCVFPNDLAQFNKSITASSWDIADSKYSLGFSGTKDTHWILPNYIKLLQSKNHQINGTDGKMIQQMLDHTLEVNIIQQNSDSLWKRFCESSLKLKVGCIIDAGAILAGMNLENEIIPWMSSHQQFKKLGYKGISYCNEFGFWNVYDTQSHTVIPRDTSIPQHETFVIFDEARTRGADIKMKTDTKAVLSLGPNMMKDKLMQAVGRLRKFGRNQKIYILSTRQNYSKIDNFSHQETSTEKTKRIIEWVCSNSIKDNKKMLFPNAKLSWIHFQNVCSQKTLTIQQFNPTLDNMYKQKIKHQTVFHLNEEIAVKYETQFKYSEVITELRNVVKDYGHNYSVRCQHLEDVCEREVQMVEENEKQRQKQLTLLTPIDEKNSMPIYNGHLSTVNIRLNKKLFFTQNFKKCTYYEALKGRKQNGQQNNELCQINFVLVNTLQNQITILTQKQANRAILQGIQNYGPYSVQKPIKGKFIARFGDLNIDLDFIKQFKLERVLTDAQYFNGKQLFGNRQLLLETITQNLKQLHENNIEEIICHFIKRRRTVENKFYCSDLEKIYKQIISSQ